MSQSTSTSALISRNPFGAGTVFQYGKEWDAVLEARSQSLWSRDGFSMQAPCAAGASQPVAIPLEQGRFFNLTSYGRKWERYVAIPLEQGRFFTPNKSASAYDVISRNPFGAGTVFQ